MGTIIHATNIPYTQRSHFDGQNLMETGGRVPYEIKTGWLGRTMKLAKLQGDGLALSLPMPLLLRGVPKNDNYYPAKGIMPRKEILEILRSVYLDKSEEELLNMITNNGKELLLAARIGASKIHDKNKVIFVKNEMSSEWKNEGKKYGVK